jgi:large subunit ribosomal protein L1
MDANRFADAVKKVKEQIAASKKKFTQSIDLVVILKPRKMKNEAPIDAVAYLPNKVSDIKTCAFVDKDIVTQANGVFSKVILKDDFAKYDKKSVRKLSKEYNYFFAEASIMPQAAAKFGKQLTALNKMPNPKTGTVISPASDFTASAKKITAAVRINTKKNNAVLVKVGDEKLEDSKIVENISSIYSLLKQSLGNGEADIKHMYLKPTMGEKIAV